MIKQRIILDKYDWEVDIYYDTTCRDFKMLIKELKQLGCNGEDLRKLYKNLKPCSPNKGATYSDFNNRKSIMIIGRTLSMEQFLNTYEHERGHLEMHIILMFDIDVFGEEQCYLRGDIAQKMYPVLRYFLC